jgi:hypothetical protein
MTTASTHPKPRRRWFRFSLRTMLVFTALACLALGWWVNAVQRQRRAIAAIKQNGGWFGYREDDSKKSKFKDWIREHATDWLGQNANDILGLDLFCDSWVEYFSTPNADLILLQCRELSSLTHIDLRYSGASDLGVRYLRGHRNLEALKLSGCENITDSSVPILAEFKSLRRLNLCGTKVTNASLPKLATMKNLRYLTLPGMQLTEEERDMLQNGLPNSNIYIGDEYLPLELSK